MLEYLNQWGGRVEGTDNGFPPVLKTGVRKDMWVRLPPPPPIITFFDLRAPDFFF